MVILQDQVGGQLASGTGNSQFSVEFKEFKQALRGFFKDRLYVWPFYLLNSGSSTLDQEIVSLIV
jgi:hypothetical protein